MNIVSSLDLLQEHIRKYKKDKKQEIGTSLYCLETFER